MKLKKLTCFVSIMLSLVLTSCTSNAGRAPRGEETQEPSKANTWIVRYVNDDGKEKTINLTTDDMLPKRFAKYRERVVYVKVPSGIKQIGVIGSNSRKPEVVISKDGTEIVWYVFLGCTNLKKVDLPSSLKVIGWSVFEGCKVLKGIDLSNVEVIGVGAFQGCTGLTELKIPEGVKEIRAGAFMECSSLKEIKISPSFDEIGTGAFYGCGDITRLTIPSNISVYFDVFGGCSIANVILIDKEDNGKFKKGTEVALNVRLTPDAKVFSSSPNLIGQEFCGRTIERI